MRKPRSQQGQHNSQAHPAAKKSLLEKYLSDISRRRVQKQAQESLSPFWAWRVLYR